MSEKKKRKNRRKGVDEMSEVTLTKFIDYLSKSKEEFKRSIYDEEFLKSLIIGLKVNNIKKVIKHIELDERMGDGNILNNLLKLDPISLPILDEFIKSNYLEKESFCVRVDKVRQITSSILNSLKSQKLKIRKGCAAVKNIQDSEDQLNDVIKELEKHEEKLMILEEEREKKKGLDEVKNKIATLEKELDVKNIDELHEKVKYYESKKSEIDKIKKEIVHSKTMFKDLPQDEA